MNVFEIQRRSVKSGKWSLWCRDNDREVMDTRFEYMSALLKRDASEFDACRLVSNGEICCVPVRHKKEIQQ